MREFQIIPDLDENPTVRANRLPRLRARRWLPAQACDLFGENFNVKRGFNHRWRTLQLACQMAVVFIVNE
jgi:hypothetical protein